MNKITFPSLYPVTCHTAHVGPGSTFVAIKGLKDDGAQYIEKALELGATTIVVEHDAKLTDVIQQKIQEKQAKLVVVHNTRKALAELSAQAHGYPAKSLKIIGITGTKGKTTTTFLIEHILRTAGYKTALLSTVKNQILGQVFGAELTTAQPDYLHTFFAVCREQGVEYVVMEVAAQAMSLHRVEGMLFDAAVFTNFSLEHSEFYTNQDEYFAAKCRLFSQLAPGGAAYFNADDERVKKFGRGMGNAQFFSVMGGPFDCALPLAQGACLGKLVQMGENYFKTNHEKIDSSKQDDAQNERSITCSLGNIVQDSQPAEKITGTLSEPPGAVEGAVHRIKKAINFICHIQQSDLAALRVSITSQKNVYNLSMNALLGGFNASNLAAATAIAERYGVSSEILQQAVATFPGVPGRLQRFSLPNGAVAFIDNAHTPSSFEAILSALRPLSSHIIAVFGAGGDRDPIKRPIMGALAALYADQVIITTDNPRSEDPIAICAAINAGIEQQYRHKVETELDREKAIRCAYALSKPGTIIALLGKGPVEYQHVKDTKHPFSEAAILKSL